MEKTVRKRELDKFRDGKVKYLITTDLLSRGMDILQSAVIHYHCPVTLESFRHRSGRTGRGAETGSNYILITAQDLYRLKKIEKSTTIWLPNNMFYLDAIYSFLYLVLKF